MSMKSMLHIHLKISSTKWRSFCFGINAVKQSALMKNMKIQQVIKISLIQYSKLHSNKHTFCATSKSYRYELRYCLTIVSLIQNSKLYSNKYTFCATSKSYRYELGCCLTISKSIAKWYCLLSIQLHSNIACFSLKSNNPIGHRILLKRPIQIGQLWISIDQHHHKGVSVPVSIYTWASPPPKMEDQI